MFHVEQRRSTSARDPPGRQPRRRHDKLGSRMRSAAPEDLALIQMQKEDCQNKDHDECSGKENDDRKEAGLIWRQLLDLNVLQVILQAVREALRVVILVFHAI